jgi:hypothetical protein
MVRTGAQPDPARARERSIVARTATGPAVAVRGTAFSGGTWSWVPDGEVTESRWERLPRKPAAARR